MKKVFFNIAMMMAVMTVGAQNTTVTAPEPEFINTYCLLTGADTYDALPKETGEIQKHQNKVSKFAKIAGGISQAAGAAGIIGISTAGSMGGVVNGLRVVGAASGVGQMASAADVLGGAVGMDIVFQGGSSSYQVEDASEGVKLLIKADNNEQDPMDIYRIVRFTGSKKERRVQWLQFEPALLGSGDAGKAGFISFTGHKYGEQSYLLEIPADQLKKGEYGIFFMGLSTVIPTGTFSVK